jgi:hypothetical protein
VLRNAVINIAVLALTVPACANAQNGDAQVLADNMPAMELQTDATISSAYKPYLDCYARTIESGPGSSLTDDGEARETLQRAAEHCTASKQTGTDLAASHLTSSKPEMSEGQRNDLLTRYRRQQGVFALINRYRERGRSHLLQAYFERIGRAERENRTFVMLSAE